MRSLHLLSLCVSIASADFLLGRFPAPTDLSSEESLVAASWKNVTSILDEYLNGNQNSTSEAIASVKNTTFSFGMFSVHDSATSKSLQYHYTASNLNPNGTSKVDGDTIYRVASVTKLFTVL